MEKKKIAIVAIIIFIFVGLMVFTFANPEEEKPGTTKPGEKTEDVVNPEKQNKDEEIISEEEASESKKSVVDDSYDKALKAVEDAEKLLTREAYDKAVALVAKSSKNKNALNERLEKVDHDLDIQELVNDLNNKLASATSRADILAAISFRDEKSINAELVATVNNAELKGTLETLMTDINKVLDDETAPSINLDKEYYNEDVTVTFEDDNELVISVSKNGEEAVETENGSEFTEEGTYTVTATDKAFNEKTYTFTIDKTAPVVNVNSGSQSKQNIDFVVTELNFDKAMAYKDHASVATEYTDKEFSLTEDGTYQVVILDKAGNSITVWVAIDKTTPVIEGVTNKAFVNTDVELVITDRYLMTVEIDGTLFNRSAMTVGTNGENFKLTNTVSEEGKHKVVATDKAGNVTTYTFTIDKTKPTMNTANVGVSSETDPTAVLNHIAGKNKTINFTGFVSEEIDLDSIEFYLVQGENEYRIPSKNVGTTNLFGVNMYLGNIKVDANITLADGYVDLVARNVKDLAGNVAEDMSLLKEGVTLLIDRTAPVISVKDSSVGTNNIYSVVDFKINDNFNLKKAVLNDTYTVNKDGASRSLNFASYGSKYVEGKNTWVVYDEAGNTATYTFTLDTTAPVVSASGSSRSSKVYSTEPIVVKVEDANLDKVYYKFTSSYKDADKMNCTTELSVTETETGVYTGNVDVSNIGTSGYLYVKTIDKAGNVTYSRIGKFFVDAVAPTATIEYTTTDFTNNDVVATLVPSEGVTVTNNEGSFTYTFTENGEFTFEFVDRAGNTGTATATVTKIDKVAPVVSASGSSMSSKSYSNKPLVVKVEETNLDKVYYKFTSSYKNANEISYTTELSVTEGETGVYTGNVDISNISGNGYLYVKAVDKAGNITYYKNGKFFIDGVAPTLTDTTQTTPVFNPFNPTPVNIDTVLTFSEDVKIKKIELVGATDATGDIDYGKITTNTGNETGKTFTFSLNWAMGVSNNWDQAKITFVDRAGNEIEVYSISDSQTVLVQVLTN